LNEALQADPVLYRSYRSGRKLIVGGSVALGIGGLSLLGAASLVSILRTEKMDGEPLASQDRRALWGGLAFTSLLGVGLVVTGAILVPKGVRRRKEALETARARLGWFPALGPGYAGLGAGGWF
jgi:hypothetical protein